jgi:hypothetical protein
MKASQIGRYSKYIRPISIDLVVISVAYLFYIIFYILLHHLRSMQGLGCFLISFLYYCTVLQNN